MIIEHTDSDLPLAANSPKLRPAAPEADGLTPNERFVECADDLIHRLAASSVLLRALICELDNGALSASDLRASLGLLYGEAQAAKRTLLSALEGVPVHEEHPAG